MPKLGTRLRRKGKSWRRNHRRDAIDVMKKSKELSEDDQRRVQEEIQKLTDRHTDEMEKLVESKSNELMTL